MKTIFKSHTQWAQCARWSTVNEHLFVSGGYDSLVKLWDTRRLVNHLIALNLFDSAAEYKP